MAFFMQSGKVEVWYPIFIISANMGDITSFASFSNLAPMSSAPVATSFLILSISFLIESSVSGLNTKPSIPVRSSAVALICSFFCISSPI